MSNEELKDMQLPISINKVFWSEWRWWLSGGVISFVLASILLTSWPAGLIPNISYPYTYKGDGLSYSWLTLRAMEGWIFENPRSGFPFGSNFLDYPSSDSGNILILKILGLITRKYYSAINIFILLSFSVNFTASYFTLRAFGLISALSFAASLLFSFLPFHFLRLNHLFYHWYFIVPIIFFQCYYFYEYKKSNSNGSSRWRKIVLLFATSIIIASFGVYYALFGLIALSACALTISIKKGNFRSSRGAVIAILLIAIGVFLNLLPSISHKFTNGNNPEVAVRAPYEAETYGLKLMQLILPRSGHRDSHLASFTQFYNQTYPLINENSSSALGLIGSIGFACLLFILLAALSGKLADSRLLLLSMLVLVFFLFGTIGGFGSLFSATVSSSIRGWNRISVFIAFGSIAAFFIGLQILICNLFSRKRANIILIGCAVIFGGIGLYDQTVPACLACNGQNKSAFENDRSFISEIEKCLPKGSAVYQLPYMPFPESGPLNRLDTYGLSIGFLHSKELHWNYAGMKGREGDLFYRALAQEPIEKQLEVITRMGFSGIYIDRRGFEDNADLLIDRLSVLLGYGPLLKRADGQIVFFRIPSTAKPNLFGLSNFEIMRKAGFDKLGVRHIASLSDGIDFTKRTWPEFIRDVRGISVLEPWGRWSDANLGQSVRFDFVAPLPARFTLVLSARAFGRNGEQAALIRLGDQVHRLNLRHGESDFRLPIDLGNKQIDVIEVIPLQPVSPKELSLSGDSRKLGIGFIRLRFEE